MSAMKIIRRATVAVGLSAVLLAPLSPAQAVSGPDPEPRPTSSPSYSPKDAGKTLGKIIANILKQLHI